MDSLSDTSWTLEDLSEDLADGDGGLSERSQRPRTMPRRTCDEVEEAVVAVRTAHPAWGGRKIAAVLWRKGLEPPAASTIAQILRRHGMALGEDGTGPAARGRFEHEAPNDLWQMDFKGHVGLERGGRCHPLMVLDDHSRFNILTAAYPDQRRESVHARLNEAFERYGKPRRIVCDNGPPWGAGSGDADEAGLTGLGVWLIEHDIAMSHSRPYHPQTCGKDERYHRTLKAEAMREGFADLVQAQQAFDRFRATYSCERPHQGIGMAVPVERYQVSPRRFCPIVIPFDYGPDVHPRKVDQTGKISFKNRTIRIPKAFRQKTIALRPTQTDGVYELTFRTLVIRTLDLRTNSECPRCVRTAVHLLSGPNTREWEVDAKRPEVASRPENCRVCRLRRHLPRCAGEEMAPRPQAPFPYAITLVLPSKSLDNFAGFVMHPG